MAMGKGFQARAADSRPNQSEYPRVLPRVCGTIFRHKSTLVLIIQDLEFGVKKLIQEVTPQKGNALTHIDVTNCWCTIFIFFKILSDF